MKLKITLKESFFSENVFSCYSAAGNDIMFLIKEEKSTGYEGRRNQGTAGDH
jgi:hypothetical protein